jgi:hypothetical protein
MSACPLPRRPKAEGKNLNALAQEVWALRVAA